MQRRCLQSEITLCVVEANALDDLLQSLLIVGILAILDPLADQVAQLSLIHISEPTRRS